MCEARFLFEHRKARGDLTNASVPAGTLVPGGGGREFDSCYAVCSAVSFDDHLNSVPSIHIRCRMTASFRATATLALRSPLRFASRMPHALSADHFATRVSSTLAALVEVTSQHFITAFRDSSRPGNLAGCI